MGELVEVLLASECRLYRLKESGWEELSKGYGWLTLSRHVATNITELKVMENDEVLLAMPMASNMEQESPDGRHCSFRQPATPHHYLLRFRDEKTCGEFLDVFRREMLRAEPLNRPHSTSSTSLQDISPNPPNTQTPSAGDTAKAAEPPPPITPAPEITRAFFGESDGLGASSEWTTDGEGTPLVESLTSSFTDEPSSHSFEAITYHHRPGHNDLASGSNTAAKKIALEFRAREAELNSLKLENQMLRKGLLQSQENARQWEKELEIGRQNFALQLSRLQQAVSAAERWRRHLGESKEGLLAAQAMARELVLAIDKMHAATKQNDK